MSARFEKINRQAEERFEELRATGQTFEVLESQISRELKVFPNLRSNDAQRCKRVLSRIQEARKIERATASNPLPTPKDSQSPAPEPLEPTPLPKPDPHVSRSPTPAKIVKKILKTNVDAYQTPAMETPTTICPTTLEYLGTNLTEDQLYYNSLARRVGTREIIEERIKRGLEELDEEIEWATRRAHSWAECKVSMLAGYLDAKRREESEQPAKKRREESEQPAKKKRKVKSE